MPYEIHLVLSDGTPRDFFRRLNDLIGIYPEYMLYEMTRPIQYQVPTVLISIDSEVSADISETDITLLDIRNLGLKTRTINALKWAYRRGFARSEIETIGDLLGYSAEDLLDIPHFGKVGLCDLRVALAKYGLHLMLEDVYELEEG